MGMKNYLLAILLACASCAHYRPGTTLPAEYRTIEIGPVVNLTSEARLESDLRNSLSESVMNTPGVCLGRPGAEGGLLLSAKIAELSQQRGARARLRAPHDRDRSGKAYQTVVFRMTLKVEYQAVAENCGEPVRSGVVTVSADYPTMADQETARAEALREAMRSAARQIVAEVTEG